MQTDLQIERDCLAGFGLLTSTYLNFDPPLNRDDGVSHSRGFNVHCMVIDNTDGEVLALGQNLIHQHSDPLQHAEQRVIRAAISRVQEKRPRPATMPVDQYYKSQMFMQPGTSPADFYLRGCTLYNTFDPCGMCAVTLLASYMKRVAYLFEDAKFAEVYDLMRRYFGGRESVKEAMMINTSSTSPFVSKGSEIIVQLRRQVAELAATGVPLVMTLDRCYEHLADAAAHLIGTSAEELVTTGPSRSINARTLYDIKRLCNVN